ncbi:MAG: PEP-CTERM sorting domain-containing protein [Alphaproteobacteria bacterium]
MVLVLGAVQQASAASILIFGDGFGTTAAGDLEATLTGLGHTVVNHGAATPLSDADFVGIDTAWHVGSSATYLSNSQTALLNFMVAGGGLHLTGENPALASSQNAALLHLLVNPLITGSSLSEGGSASSIVTISLGLPPSIADVLTVPNDIIGRPIGAFATGELVGVDADNVFANDGSTVVGAVYGAGDLIVPGARLSIMMDVNWLSSSFDADVVDNLQTFLQGGPEVVAMSEPGTVLLLAAAGLFVVASRRRERA